MHCPNGHLYPYLQHFKIPIFSSVAEPNDYTQNEAATIHDNGLQWVFATFGTDEPSLRESLVSRLHLSKGQTVLVTGAGTGNDLPFIVNGLEGGGIIYAQDISQQMLMEGVKRYGSLSNADVQIHFSASDALNLPFANNAFDCAYHFGGLNLFPDIQKGIAEMDRVVKPGGRIVISDEGIAPWLKQTPLGGMLIQNNALYAYDAPLSLLPSTAKSVKLSWELNHCFYVIEYVVSTAPTEINIDIPHVGKRGGTIRKRYFGQLEGIDPSLREKIYAKAKELGMSRVEYLEQLLSLHLN